MFLVPSLTQRQAYVKTHGNVGNAENVESVGNVGNAESVGNVRNAGNVGNARNARNAQIDQPPTSYTPRAAPKRKRLALSTYRVGT